MFKYNTLQIFDQTGLLKNYVRVISTHICGGHKNAAVHLSITVITAVIWRIGDFNKFNIIY